MAKTCVFFSILWWLFSRFWPGLVPKYPLAALLKVLLAVWTLIAILFISDAGSSVKASAVQEEVSFSKSQAFQM